MYNTVNIFSVPFDFLNDIFSSLLDCKNTVCNKITYKICCNQLLMLFIRLLINSKLLVVKFLGNQKLYIYFQLAWVGNHYHCFLQRSTVYCFQKLWMEEEVICLSSCRLFLFFPKMRQYECRWIWLKTPGWFILFLNYFVYCLLVFFLSWCCWTNNFHQGLLLWNTH